MRAELRAKKHEAHVRRRHRKLTPQCHSSPRQHRDRRLGLLFRPERACAHVDGRGRRPPPLPARATAAAGDLHTPQRPPQQRLQFGGEDPGRVQAKPRKLWYGLSQHRTWLISREALEQMQPASRLLNLQPALAVKG